MSGEVLRGKQKKPRKDEPLEIIKNTDRVQ
jgi:hypothetical protein